MLICSLLMIKVQICVHAKTKEISFLCIFDQLYVIIKKCTKFWRKIRALTIPYHVYSIHIISFFKQFFTGLSFMPKSLINICILRGRYEWNAQWCIVFSVYQYSSVRFRIDVRRKQIMRNCTKIRTFEFMTVFDGKDKDKN